MSHRISRIYGDFPIFHCENKKKTFFNNSNMPFSSEDFKQKEEKTLYY
jgi:hypothetical protein